MRSLSALALLSLVPACSGGSASPAPAPAPTPAPVPAPSPAPTPTPSPTPPPTGNFFTDAAAMYVTQPDIAGCRQGQLAPAVTAEVLRVLNEMRALHRLPPVAYSGGDEAAAQAAALIMAANAQLSHQPPPSWRCHTDLGATGARTSNLYGGTGNGLRLLTNEEVLIGWLTDVNNAVANSVGHRRWMLDPFLNAVAYGRVAGPHDTRSRTDAAALKVMDNSGPTPAPASLPPFVAYPYGDYPARYFHPDALFSFGAIVNPSSRWANQSVDYSAATVSVRQRGGASLAVSRIAFDNDGYGLPNNLQFAVAGVQLGVTYDVTIENVRVGSNPTSYSYAFRLVS